MSSFKDFKRMREFMRPLGEMDEPMPQRTEFQTWGEYYDRSQWRGDGNDAAPAEAHNYPNGKSGEDDDL